jgi:steroid 5-alpha reductase family enzyme
MSISAVIIVSIIIAALSGLAVFQLLKEKGGNGTKEFAWGFGSMLLAAAVAVAAFIFNRKKKR